MILNVIRDLKRVHHVVPFESHLNQIPHALLIWSESLTHLRPASCTSLLSELSKMESSTELIKCSVALSILFLKCRRAALARFKLIHDYRALSSGKPMSASIFTFSSSGSTGCYCCYCLSCISPPNSWPWLKAWSICMRPSLWNPSLCGAETLATSLAPVIFATFSGVASTSGDPPCPSSSLDLWPVLAVDLLNHYFHPCFLGGVILLSLPRLVLSGAYFSGDPFF